MWVICRRYKADYRICDSSRVVEEVVKVTRAKTHIVFSSHCKVFDSTGVLVQISRDGSLLNHSGFESKTFVFAQSARAMISNAEYRFV